MCTQTPPPFRDPRGEEAVLLFYKRTPDHQVLGRGTLRSSVILQSRVVYIIGRRSIMTYNTDSTVMICMKYIAA